MPKYGKTSRDRLNSCNTRIQKIMNEVISRLPWFDPATRITIYDCGIIEGHRGEARQNYLESTGQSEVTWPNSRHNAFPSNAVDALPYHADLRGKYAWGNWDEHEVFSRLVLSVAEELGYKLRWGGDWDRDGIRVDRDSNEHFFDGPHFEEVKLWVSRDTTKEEM